MLRACFASLIGLSLMGLAGCQSDKPVVLPAQKHAPSVAADVKVYQKAPLKYEILGNVSAPATAKASWQKDADATEGFTKLKTEAAKLGANGILLTSDVKENMVVVLAKDSGTGYQVPVRMDTREAIVKAIFVHEEKK